jgi:hypothetical protein
MNDLINHDKWLTWAMQHNAPAEVVAFIHLHPEWLRRFPDIEAEASLFGPMDRTYYAVAEWDKFLPIFRNGPTAQEIIYDPHIAPIPPTAPELYAIAAKLAAATHAHNFSEVAVYLGRLLDVGHESFAIVAVRDAVRRRPEILTTAAFSQFASEKLHGLLVRNPAEAGLPGSPISD